MKAKKGISLIVLVITIIVIIILAAAVLLSINNNNPVANARNAVDESDTQEVQSAVTLYLGTVMADIQQSVTIDPGEEPSSMDNAAIKPKAEGKIIQKGDDGKFTISDSGSDLKFTNTELGLKDGTIENYQINEKGQVSPKDAE